ncbi:MAG: M28 family peptidase [Pseudomonadota bacterium]
MASGTSAKVEVRTSDLIAAEELIFERSTRDQREAAAQLLQEALIGAGLSVQLQSYRVPNEHWVLDFFLPPVTGINVVSELPATSATAKTIIVGAHYDTKQGSPGADDNASGVIALVRVAQHLAALNQRSANVIFVLFDQEEQGSIGSLVFAARMQADKRQVHSMHNIDMIGYDKNADGLFDLDAPDGEIADTYLAVAQELNVPINRTTFDSSDHISFRKRGYAAAFLTENLSGGDFNPNYHSPKDTEINQAYLDSGTLLASAVLERLVTP